MNVDNRSDCGKGNEVQSGQQDELGCCPFEAQTREEAERISQGLTC